MGKKMIRGSLDDAKPVYANMELHERIFEEFRTWMLASDRRALAQNFFQNNIVCLVVGFIGLVWLMVYLCSSPSVTVDSLQQCIPKRYRDVESTLPQTTKAEPKQTTSSTMDRLAKSGGS